MEIAYDSATGGVFLTTNTSGSWPHTPVLTLRGLVVSIWSTQATNFIATVTAGGVPMTQVSGSPLLKATGEPFGLAVFFLGSNIPFGSITIAVTVNGAGNGVDTYYTDSFGYKAPGNTMIVNTASLTSDALADPLFSLGLRGRRACVLMPLGTGQDGPFSTSPLTNWLRADWQDMGTVSAVMHQYGSDVGYGPVAGDLSVGWTQTSEDAMALAIAIGDVPADIFNYPSQ
jgi:hypothetical protein